MSVSFEENVRMRLDRLSMQAMVFQRVLRELEDAVSLGVVRVINQTLRKLLADLEHDLGRFVEFGRQQESNVRALYIRDRLPEYKQLVEMLPRDMKKANIRCRVKLQRSARNDREELLSGATIRSAQRQILRDNPRMMREAAERTARGITSSLEETRSMLLQELDRSSGTLHALKHSNDSIKGINSEYESYGATLSAGKHIISILERRQHTEKQLILLAFLCFLIIVAHVWLQRLPFVDTLWDVLRFAMGFIGDDEGQTHADL